MQQHTNNCLSFLQSGNSKRKIKLCKILTFLLIEHFGTFSLTDNDSYEAGCLIELKLQAKNEDLRI